MSKNRIHSKSGLDRILSANAASSFIGTSSGWGQDAHRSDADVRRSAHNQTWLRAVKLTDSEDAALALFEQAIAWADEFTAADREEVSA